MVYDFAFVCCVVGCSGVRLLDDLLFVVCCFRGFLVFLCLSLRWFDDTAVGFVELEPWGGFAFFEFGCWTGFVLGAGFGLVFSLGVWVLLLRCWLLLFV